MLDAPRAYLFSHGDESLNDDALRAFDALLGRRLQGEPLAYLTEQRSFWTLTLGVGPGVLIPRPETELLVEAALERLPQDPASRTPQSWRLLDLGTGSGAIALALASERPHAEVTATDLSRDALEVAQRNAQHNQLQQVRFLQSDWFESVQGTFDMILSNPPYVAEDDEHLARGDCRFEPRAALTPGRDALAAYRRIIAQAPRYLAPGGWLLFEHGYEQGEAVRELLSEGAYRGIETLRDLQGHERVSLAQRPGHIVP